MSAVVTIRFPVADVAKAIEGLHAQAAFLDEISEGAKGTGLVHHRFVAGDGEILVIDEWDTPEQFQAFFEGNPKVGEVMGGIGMTGEPEVSVYASIDAAGTL
jgi:heme-degrading monooxygenase HmoA